MIGEEHGELLWDIIRVLFALSAVIILILLTRRFLNRILYHKSPVTGKGNGGLIIKQRVQIGEKKQLLVAEFEDQVLLLAVSEEGITLLKENPLPGPEIKKEDEEKGIKEGKEGEEAPEDEA